MRRLATISALVFVLAIVCACKSAPAETGTPAGPNDTTHRPPEVAPPSAREAAVPPQAARDGAVMTNNGESGEIPIPEKLEKKEQPVESAIRSVTVYLDRAAVTRQAKVNLEAGAYDLIFEKLPQSMDWNSVRARGADRVRVVNIKIKRDYILKPDDPEIAKLEEEMKTKMAVMAEHNDDLKRLGKKESLLDSIRMRTGEKATEGMEAKLDVANLGDVVDFLDRGYQAIDRERRELNRKILDLQAEINLVQRKINDLRSKLTVENIKAVVTVMVSEKAEEEIALDYVVSGASWRPEYDLRTAAAEESAELSYYGVVSQQTGEDWKDVQLLLSTARPDIAVIPPTLRVWSIGAMAPETATVDRLGGKMPQASQQGQQGQQGQYARDYFSDKKQAEQDLQTLNAQIQASVIAQGGVAVTFAVPRMESVVSGPEPHRTIITVRTLKPRSTFITIPRHRQEVYMQAEIKNSTPYTLLAGRMNVFFGANYVGTTGIDHVAPTQDFKVNFGTDGSVRVKRERISKYAEDVGWGGKRRRVTYEYKITLQNFKSTDALVNVLDQIPVSTEKDIVVKLVSANFNLVTEEPKASENEKQGILEWQAQLPPDPKRKNEIIYKYYIEYPKEMSVYGAE